MNADFLAYCLETEGPEWVAAHRDVLPVLREDTDETVKDADVRLRLIDSFHRHYTRRNPAVLAYHADVIDRSFCLFGRLERRVFAPFVDDRPFTWARFDSLELCFGSCCLRCGKPIQFRRSARVPATVDHIVPSSLGGRDIISNIQPLCGSCNSSKGATFADYRPMGF